MFSVEDGYHIGQDETDTTIIPFVPDGAICGKGVITCSVIKLMLVLLVYWGVSGGPTV